MLLALRSAVLPVLLSVALAQPAAAQGFDARPMQPQGDGSGLALGLAAIAALGLLLQEADEDDGEERDARERRERTLPARCLATWRTANGGAATLYDPDCLEKRFPATGRLPLACAVTIRSDGRFVSGFSPACLRERGWRTPH